MVVIILCVIYVMLALLGAIRLNDHYRSIKVWLWPINSIFWCVLFLTVYLRHEY